MWGKNVSDEITWYRRWMSFGCSFLRSRRSKLILSQLHNVANTDSDVNSHTSDCEVAVVVIRANWKKIQCYLRRKSTAVSERSLSYSVRYQIQSNHIVLQPMSFGRREISNQKKVTFRLWSNNAQVVEQDKISSSNLNLKNWSRSSKTSSYKFKTRLSTIMT